MFPLNESTRNVSMGVCVCDICGMYVLCAAGTLSIKTADHGEAECKSKRIMEGRTSC